jgi:hypothetical protein
MLLPLVEHANLIPNHQFGFRPRHSTIEQTHRLIRVLNDALDNSQCWSAAFLDIFQAFDKVWHTGLVYKLKRSLSLNYFLILNSYLSNLHFVVNVHTELTGLTLVNARVPQGSVLGPFLHLLYTADLPTSPDSFTATFADDTAVVATDSDPATASHKLQTTLLAIQSWWLRDWRIKANETKSVQCDVHYKTRNVPTGPYKWCANTSREPSQIPWTHLDRRLTWHTHILPNVNSSGSRSPRCTGYSDGSPNSLPTTNSSSTK